MTILKSEKINCKKFFKRGDIIVISLNKKSGGMS